MARDTFLVTMADYKLLLEIGRGGMGIVYSALQLPLKREVAVKVLPGLAGDSLAMKTRFHRELESCVKLVHPNIIKIFDFGEMDGRPFFAMEYLSDSVSLEQLIDRDGPLTPQRAVAIMTQLLDALAYCHERSMIHRDVKPSNLMVRKDGHVTLMDFGLVRDLARTALTEEGLVLGTPRFTSPEALTIGAVTPAVDLWASGAVFYEMLAGQPAFMADDRQALMARIVLAQYEPLTRVRPELPASVDTVVGRFLAAAQEDRVGSATEASRLLQEWLARSAGSAAEPGGKPQVRRPTVRTAAGPRAASPPVRQRRARWGLPLGAALALASIGALIAVLPGPDRRSDPPGPTRATAPSPNAVTGLRWTPFASSGVLTFDSARPGRFSVHVEPAGGGSLAPAPLSQRRDTSQAVELERLEPGVTYRIVVVDEQGAQVARIERATLTLVEAARVVRRALEAVAPGRAARQLASELVGAADKGAPPGTVRAARGKVAGRWAVRLADGYKRVDLAGLVRRFHGIKDRVFESAQVAGEDKFALYSLAQDLEELESTAARGMLQLPALWRQLVSDRYGQLAGSRVLGPTGAGPLAGLALVLEGANQKKYRDVPALPATSVVVSPDGDPFYFAAFSDLRDGADDGALDPLGQSVYTYPDPLPLAVPARPAAVEIAAALHKCRSGGGFRVMISRDRPRTRQRWTLLAQLRPTHEERAVVSHSIPPELLPAGTIHLRIELAYHRSMLLEQDVPKQDGAVMWLAILWRGR
ncbi:MAG: protein kinase [Candidatus Riflebacteria bacterium]|nr:protein kinase [Candidatus Riflebacteria bacterium]